MRTAFIIILSLFTTRLCGQNGYVILDSDSIVTGYLRYYTSINDGHQGIELWRTKKDKSPLKISKQIIREYAIKSDTFKVLHQFKPFPRAETYFEIVDAKLITRGKVNLYIIENYQNTSRVSTYTGGGIIPAVIDESLGNHTYFYILEDNETGFLNAMPAKKERLKEALRDFFPDRYITKYDEVKGAINYKSIPDLVKLYNSK